VGSRSLPSRRLPLPFPSPSFHPLPSPFLPLPSPPHPLEVDPLIQLWSLRERCKLPQRGLGRKLNLVHFSLKNLTSGGNNFNDFPESQLTKFQTFMLMFAEFRGRARRFGPPLNKPLASSVRHLITHLQPEVDKSTRYA